MNTRNTATLSVSQALSSAGSSMVVLLGALVSANLAPDRSLVTLPMAVTIAGTALCTIPAALLMRRVGRRLGFALGASVAGIGSLLAAYAIATGSFYLFCLGTFFIGTNAAFVQQYRFAAAESVHPTQTGRAISVVLLGGIAAGFLGPLLGRSGKDWLPAAEYAGSFAGLAVLYCVCLLLMLVFFRNPITATQELTGSERPLREVIGQPRYLRAVWAAAVAYGAMSFIMTGAPISMHLVHRYGLADTAFVIQSHVIAMFLPSVFSGYLIDRLGAVRLQIFGVISILLCAMLALLAPTLLTYWTALVLLGIGWNLLFVGATVALTRTYYPRERFKAQAFNDFLVFGVQAAATLASGAIVLSSDWLTLNVVLLPLLLATLALVTYRHRRAVPAVPTPE